MKQEFKTQKLVGQYFHIYEYSNRTKHLELVEQGCVEGKVMEEYYICQTFSFGDGSEIHSKLVHVRDMKDWKFYKSNTLMHEQYEHYYDLYQYRLAKTNNNEEFA